VDTDGDNEYSTPAGKEYSLPISEIASTNPAMKPADPIVPAATQQHVAGNLEKDTKKGEMTRNNQPIRVEIIREDELSKFEGKTVRFGKWGLVIASLSLIAAVAAAIFVWEQFVEMAGQTDILAMDARRARDDSAAASVATSKQLWLFQRQLTEAHNANELNRKQWEAQNRPWIGIENPTTLPATYAYMWPKTFLYPSVDVDVRFSIKNYGPSPAHILPAQLALIPWASGRSPNEPSLREACKIDSYRRPGQVTFQGDVGEVILPSSTKPIDQGLVTGFGKTTPKELTGFSLTVCLVYQDTVGKWHYSGYLYRTWGRSAATAVPDHEGWSYNSFNSVFLVGSATE